MRVSYAVWAVWLAIFLALELPAVWGLVPWSTFSHTSEVLEQQHWVIHAAVFGFGIGLVIHITFYAGMGRAQLLGMLVSFGLHFVNRTWP